MLGCWSCCRMSTSLAISSLFTPRLLAPLRRFLMNLAAYLLPVLFSMHRLTIANCPLQTKEKQSPQKVPREHTEHGKSSNILHLGGGCDLWTLFLLHPLSFNVTTDLRVSGFVASTIFFFFFFKGIELITFFAFSHRILVRKLWYTDDWKIVVWSITSCFLARQWDNLVVLREPLSSYSF